MWCSYSLWLEFTPQMGLEEFHCHKKRGYSRLISKEQSNVNLLKNQDTIPQRIGKLSQQAIYQLHHHPQYLTHSGIEVIASDFLHLHQEDKEVEERVFKVLQNYLEKPFLVLENREVIFLESGNERPKKVFITFDNVKFPVYFKIENSEASDIIVAVKTRRWGEDSYPHYVLNGLEIPINRDNAKHLGVNYDFYQRKTKIPLNEWLKLLIKAHKNTSNQLANWGIEIEGKYINYQNYSQNFYVSKFNQDSVKLLFGDNVIKSRSQIKSGLKEGGVYRRHENFNNPSIPLQVVVLKLCQAKASNFLKRLENQLKNLKFPVSYIERTFINIEGNMSETDAAKIEEKIKKIIGGLRPDLVITILPKHDKELDHTERGSYYYHISHQLIPQGIASQMISEENLNNSNILNNTVLGILAKLGNLPFIFAEPLKVANYFIGLDVARERKTKTAGTINACACVRIYGANGDFIRYKLDNGTLEGEEISIRILRKLVPFEELSQKTVLILRDGRFRGKEISFLKERAEAINAKFIFVEITKRGACRLFHQYKEGETIGLQKPPQYLIFKHSEKQVTIVTTKPPTGLSQPIRITIREEGIIPALNDVIEAVIKLCLLHHGSYTEAGIPMPIFASDKIGYKSLKGLSHVQGTGERQWWH